MTADVQAAEENLAITSFEIDGNNASITFTPNAGESYSLRTSNTLDAGSWTTVPGYGNITGSSSSQTLNLVNVINTSNNAKTFFRLERNPN